MSSDRGYFRDCIFADSLIILAGEVTHIRPEEMIINSLKREKARNGGVILQRTRKMKNMETKSGVTRTLPL